MAKIALAIHGGAGTILRSEMTDELEREYRTGLASALAEGWSILEKSGSALDAVEAATISLEDFPLFNAGRGSVFTHEGKNEMDAALMDGHSLKAGAVAAVKNIKNPVSLARLVMERTEHVMLAGAGANQFALEMGIQSADDAYFFTQHRYDQLLKAREKGLVELDHTAEEAGLLMDEKASAVGTRPKGTVGAVACDATGFLAAATSTGGMTNKKYGRIGDTPLIGLGTYADDLCAVSCTGYGEYFMLGVTAYDVSARMRYKRIPLVEAANESIDRLTEIKGDGGLIAVDTSGNITMPFNCDGMYRASISTGCQPDIRIYRS